MTKYEDAMREHAKLLERCSGRTVEELLAMANGKEIDFLYAIELAIEQKAIRMGEQSLSEEERIVLAIEGLEREVNNGGYSQFFTNSSGEFAPIIVESLLRIGCLENAKIAQRAIEALGVQDLSPDSLQTVFESEDDARDELLNECDQTYYSSGMENIGGKLIEFIKANKDAIHP